jgi:hypothetical protein
MTKPQPIPEGYATVTPWEEPTPEELARRYQDPRFTEAMRYLQSTLAGGLETA